MNFTDPELQGRIDVLKVRRGNFLSLPKDPLASKALDECEFDYESRYFAARIGIISNLIRTMQCSLDQISVCFAVSKAMFFYQDEIVRNPGFWREEETVNKTLLSNCVSLAFEDMKAASDKLQIEAQMLEATKGANQQRLGVILNLLDDHQILTGRAHEYSSLMIELGNREEAGSPLYDSDQKPNLAMGVTPEGFLKNYHRLSSQFANQAMILNADLAEAIFLSIDFARANNMGHETMVPDAKLIQSVIARFDVLEDTRDNRYGFTQIRFG